jgi:HEAT repeat protein
MMAAILALAAAIVVSAWAWRHRARAAYAPASRDAAFWHRRTRVPHAPIRARALKRLVEIGTADDADLIRDSLKGDEDGYVRAIAAECLGKMKHQPSIPALDAALSDMDARVSDAAVLALADTGGPKALDALIGAIDPKEERRTVMVVMSLRKFKAAEAEDALVRELDSRSAWTRWRTIRSLLDIGTTRCVPKLRDLAGDPFKDTDFSKPKFSKHDPTGVVKRMLADAIKAAGERPPWPSIRANPKRGAEK